MKDSYTTMIMEYSDSVTTNPWNTFFFRFLPLPLTKGLNTEQKSKTSKGCLLEKCWKSKLEMDGLKYEKKSGRFLAAEKQKT